jgi:GNAT superfamily N-acetyltransferase
MTVAVAVLTGADIVRVLPDVARLRMAVFRHWPYLYDGSMEYETSYLAKYAAAKGGIVVTARDGDTIVGCSTAAPLSDVEEEFAEPLRRSGMDISRIFYCAESVLLPEYRGQGVGHAFFDQREAHARALGSFTHCAFFAVLRPLDHPLRPSGHVPLDAFWHKRGYTKAEGIVAPFSWKDIDQPEETAKPLQLWMKAL